jgi:hypothetical protein
VSKSVGKAMALLLTTYFLDTGTQFNPLPQEWLSVLIRCELGVMNTVNLTVTSSSSSSSQEEQQQQVVVVNKEEEEDLPRRRSSFTQGIRNSLQASRRKSQQSQQQAPRISLPPDKDVIVVSDHFGNPIKVNKKRNLTSVLRKENCSAIAIGCYLRLALQCGGINNSVLS